jgi:hypothetical protein
MRKYTARLVVLPHDYRALLEPPPRGRRRQSPERPSRQVHEEAKFGQILGRYFR